MGTRGHQERPTWQRRAGGLTVLGALTYGVFATFTDGTPAHQLVRLQEKWTGEADLYATLILTWFAVLAPCAVLLTGIALATGGRRAARREAHIARETAASGARYYRRRIDSVVSLLRAWLRRRGD